MSAAHWFSFLVKYFYCVQDEATCSLQKKVNGILMRGLNAFKKVKSAGYLAKI